MRESKCYISVACFHYGGSDLLRFGKFEVLITSQALLSQKQPIFMQNYNFVKNDVFVAKICKYALYESSEGLFCARRKPAHFCHPGSSDQNLGFIPVVTTMAKFLEVKIWYIWMFKKWRSLVLSRIFLGLLGRLIKPGTINPAHSWHRGVINLAASSKGKRENILREHWGNEFIARQQEKEEEPRVEI